MSKNKRIPDQYRHAFPQGGVASLSLPKVPTLAETRTWKRLADETVLPDDYPTYQTYVYIADGRVIRRDDRDGLELSVGCLKRLRGYQEIRRCHIFGEGREGLRVGDFIV